VEQRSLGSTGLRVSALGFGAGAVGGLMVRGAPAEQMRAVARALAAGITYFDTAPGYGDGRSEENLGRVLRELGTWDRAVVGTKVRLGPADLADPAAAVRRSCEASLRRLGRERVDLLQVHNRVAATADGEALTVEQSTGPVAGALRRLVEAGLIGHAGFTGMGETDAVHAAVRAGVFATVQTYFNAVNPSAGYAGASGGGQDFAGLIDAAASAGLGVIVIRPFAAGALSASAARHPLAGNPGGAVMAGTPYAADLARAQALAPLAAELGLEGPLELALRFALAKAGVSTVLVGYSDLDQLEQAIRWAERGPLPAEVVQRVVTVARST
jgi:aryl-alcohol dehydrogenase-like predicted oxidoreductase